MTGATESEVKSVMNK